MKYALVALVTVLAFVPARVSAEVWSLEWFSRISLQALDPLGDIVAMQSEVSGASLARIDRLASGDLTLAFFTPAGPSSVTAFADVLTGPDERLALGDVPVFVPDLPPGFAWRSGHPPGWHLEGALGPYAWNSLFEDPETFALHLTAPPMGPAPGVFFTGTATRHTVEAAEPALLWLLGVGGLVALQRLRRRERRRCGRPPGPLPAAGRGRGRQAR
jgi:hypothetical protein